MTVETIESIESDDNKILIDSSYEVKYSDKKSCGHKENQQRI